MRRAAVAALAAIMLLAGCGAEDGGSGPVVSGVSSSDDDGYAGAYLPRPYRVGETTLTTDRGRAFSLRRDTRGRLTVLFFGYINCPDVCQVVMGTLASAYARLSAVEKRQVRVVYVTTDPARDTRSALRAYLDRLDPSFVGLTGSLDRIDAAGRPLHVFIKQGTKLPSGGYEVDHTTSFYAIDGHGTVPLVWSATTSPAEVVADVHKLLAKGAAS